MSILFLKFSQKILIFKTRGCIIKTQHKKEVINMDVGMKIKQARIAKGMTQEELGELLGVQKSAVAKYENGRVVNIKRSTLKKIADVLDIPPFELVYDEETLRTQEKNDVLADITIRMRTDAEFMSVVEELNKLDHEQFAAVKKMLTAFNK